MSLILHESSAHFFKQTKSWGLPEEPRNKKQIRIFGNGVISGHKAKWWMSNCINWSKMSKCHSHNLVNHPKRHRSSKPVNQTKRASGQKGWKSSNPDIYHLVST